MLDVESLTVRVGGRAVIEDASARIGDGRRVGLVGRNGAGKSTLLKAILGRLEPDAGRIRLPKDARVGSVAQEAPRGDLTPVEVVLAGDQERARLLAEADAAEAAGDGAHAAELHARLLDLDAHAAPARAASILAGLGFSAEAQARPISSFSGGWRMRAALAAALFSEPDVLLLDEPTNHLDLEAALWLEDFLSTWPRALLVVSHDRDFLNAVCTDMLHLSDGTLTLYGGNYDTFERTRQEKLAQTQAMAERQAAERARIQSFIDRFKAKATKARQAQSRVKALERMEPIILAAREPDTKFTFPQPDALPPPLVALDDAVVGYDGKPLLRKLQLRVDPDDRIALLGSNGNGKTTLAKLIAGALSTLEGRRVASSKLKVGYFAQHQVEELEPEATPITLLSRRMPNARPDQVRARLAGFGLTQQKAETPTRLLSGGERARLTLALITHDAPNLLILDEPTNHLDIDARDALAEALAEFDGAVILVSHDARLVETVADRLWLVVDGEARPFDGDIHDYERYILDRAAQMRAAERRSAREGTATASGGASRKDERRDAAEKRSQLAPLRKIAKAAEAKVEKLAQQKAKIDAELADPALYSSGRDVKPLLLKQAEAAKALEDAEMAWLEAAEALEAAQA